MSAVTARSARRFLASFMVLSVVSGLAIGMGRVVTTLYVLHLGAGAAEVGLIGAAEALGKMIVTLPAGFLIYRFGARRVYSAATIGSMLITLLTPLTKLWVGVAIMRTLVGFCVPFRVVSMNSSFLQRLREIGAARSGWYRGAQNIGLMLLAPTLAAVLLAHTNYFVAYAFISACFAFMVVFSRTFLPDADVAGAATSDSPLRALRGLLRIPAVRESCVIELVSHIVNALFVTFVIVLAVSVLDLSEVEAATLITVQGVTTVLALFALGPLMHSMSHRYAYALGVFGAIAALWLLAHSTRFAGLAGAAVLLSLASSLVHLVNMTTLSEVPESKSKIASLYNLAGMLGALLGSSVGGALAALLGLQHMFIAWIPVIIIAACALVLTRRRQRAGLAIVEGTSS